ncbi:MAG: hypothetical protein M0Z95_16285 [Actinomycetota bacterium]|nr:hypothetical protein [Actinomycetota bacterium]
MPAQPFKGAQALAHPRGGDASELAAVGSDDRRGEPVPLGQRCVEGPEPLGFPRPHVVAADPEGGPRRVFVRPADDGRCDGAKRALHVG